MIHAFVQARMNSRRLPGKVLKSINKKKILEIIHHRLSKSEYIKKIIIVTSNNPSDDKIEKFCKLKNFLYYRGDLQNVVSRYRDASSYYGSKCIVRICGDSPFVDYKLIDSCVSTYFKKKVDLVTNVYPRTFPAGVSVEVFSKKLIDYLHLQKLDKFEKEHVTKYFYNRKKFNIINLQSKEKMKNTLAIDKFDNLILFRNKLRNKSFINLCYRRIYNLIYG